MTSRSKRSSDVPAQSTSGAKRHLPVIGLVTAAWALLPPYSGPELNTEIRVEVADHVVPALILAVVSVVSIVLGYRQDALPATSLVSGFIVLLAGLWMVSTHVPLVAQASRSEVPWAAAIYHAAPSLAALAFGLVWIVVRWSDAPS